MAGGDAGMAVEATGAEQALVERARRGDVDAFETLVRRYDIQLRAYAAALLGFPGRWELDDVLQDVYEKAFRAMHGFRGEGRVRAWLSAIVRTTCAERRRCWARVHDVGMDAAEAAEAPALGEEVEARAVVTKALRGVPERERVVLVLAYYLDLPTAQIAEVLGEPVGTVRSRLCRARARLRDTLTEGPGGLGVTPRPPTARR